ncbi:hypothetical protein TNCV_3240181 [Trichonephila clavipes]|nr:hypothetical protein TNCV_3240181 [Trichonephila clavipes]
MLTKYQKIKFGVDFCEVWFLPESVLQSRSHRCWRSPLPHASTLIQRDFGCFGGTDQAASPRAKIDLTRIRPSWFCRKMRDSSVKTTSFHSAAKSFFHRTIGGVDICGSTSRVDQAMDVCGQTTLSVNGVEWYADTE